MVDRAFKLNVGRQGFGSVNPEIRIIEGRISEVLLYIFTIELCEGVNVTSSGRLSKSALRRSPTGRP